MTPTPEQLAALRGKYQEMLRLRRLHDAGEAGDPRREMAKLAAEFPGALREIDELPMNELCLRIEKLAAAEQEPNAVETWMRAIVRFHALTRGALCAKSWLSGRKEVHAAMREAFAREASTLCWGEDARAWLDGLAEIADPPRGRITNLVFTRLAAELGVDEARARHLVWGVPRRARPRPRTG